ncbi:hypothetical protein, conserved [Eimeria necatrix]|uniref:Uncharacterized protein n=1 Tax=Eimeria necatrix TaxID=51315 RepID=U6MXT7_9EIME|nr:hypothetical protein, conserved [Eimeria necatrix]CDJ67329.1 hypothetical protein, conserved [Eimeria necatrix]
MQRHAAALSRPGSAGEGPQSPSAISGNWGPPETQQKAPSLPPFGSLAAELQQELDAAQQHLLRFAQVFELVGSAAGDSPAADPLKIRPVSSEVRREVEAAREAHTENDDFNDCAAAENAQSGASSAAADDPC